MRRVCEPVFVARAWTYTLSCEFDLVDEVVRRRSWEGSGDAAIAPVSMPNDPSRANHLDLACTASPIRLTRIRQFRIAPQEQRAPQPISQRVTSRSAAKSWHGRTLEHHGRISGPSATLLAVAVYHGRLAGGGGVAVT